MTVPPPRHGPQEPPPALVPADPRALDDLAVLVSRAARADTDGAARLVATDRVLAVWVSPLHGAGLPTVLGLRAVPLRDPAHVDVTVELAALADRLARRTAPGGEQVTELAVPPVGVGHLAASSWAGLLPPRTGWSPTPPQEVAQLRQVAQGDPRDLAAALARAAEALGFLPAPDSADAAAPVAAATAGAWRRLSSARGHVLGRRPLLS